LPSNKQISLRGRDNGRAGELIALFRSGSIQSKRRGQRLFGLLVSTDKTMAERKREREREREGERDCWIS